METYKAIVRPTIALINGIAVVVGLFISSVSAEKLMVAASIVGGICWMRSAEKNREQK